MAIQAFNGFPIRLFVGRDTRQTEDFLDLDFLTAHQFRRGYAGFGIAPRIRTSIGIDDRHLVRPALSSDTADCDLQVPKLAGIQRARRRGRPVGYQDDTPATRDDPAAGVPTEGIEDVLRSGRLVDIKIQGPALAAARYHGIALIGYVRDRCPVDIPGHAVGSAGDEIGQAQRGICRILPGRGIAECLTAGAGIIRMRRVAARIVNLAALDACGEAREPGNRVLGHTDSRIADASQGIGIARDGGLHQRVRRLPAGPSVGIDRGKCRVGTLHGHGYHRLHGTGAPDRQVVPVKADLHDRGDQPADNLLTVQQRDHAPVAGYRRNPLSRGAGRAVQCARRCLAGNCGGCFRWHPRGEFRRSDSGRHGDRRGFARLVEQQ